MQSFLEMRTDPAKPGVHRVKPRGLAGSQALMIGSVDSGIWPGSAFSSSGSASGSVSGKSWGSDGEPRSSVGSPAGETLGSVGSFGVVAIRGPYPGASGA